MSEIDPQFENPHADLSSESRLTEAMRRLAASSQQGAPAEIGAGLANAFRRHHIRRRRIRNAKVAALVACLALAVGAISLRRHSDTSSVAQHGTTQTQPVQTPVTQAGSETSSAPKAPVTTATLPVQAFIQPARKNSQPKTTTTAYSRKFVALPGYDPAVPADELHVVRVRVSSNALWQMGAPVNPDGIGRRVMADFVVSQDGTPYAVRLVQ